MPRIHPMDFLLEANWQQQAARFFATPNLVSSSIKEPEIVTPQQLSYITRQMVNIEAQTLDSLSNPDLSAFIDTDSWIKWTITNEVMRNRDATLYGSAFFYQNTNRKIFMGPVWDVDLSAGGYTDNYPTGWYATTSMIVGTAFMYNQSYYARFKSIWNSYKKRISSLPGYTDIISKRINLSQEQNFRKWPVMSTPLFDGQVTSASYEDEVKRLKSFLTERITWIDGELKKPMPVR